MERALEEFGCSEKKVWSCWAWRKEELFKEKLRGEEQQNLVRAAANLIRTMTRKISSSPTSPALATFGGHLRYCAMASHFPEEIVRTRMAVDQARLSRLATQNAIERSRQSLAETRALLVALRYALGTRTVRRFASSKRRERG